MSDYSPPISYDASSPAPEDVERRPANVAEKETRSLQITLEAIKTFAPHMRGSFVLEDRWWVQNADKPGLHVRPFQRTVATQPLTMSPPQMFKYVLLRALETTANVFAVSVVPGPDRCEELVEEYNQKAKLIWEREEQDIPERRKECDAIYDQVFPGSCHPPPFRDLAEVPKLIAAELDSAFRQHYDSAENFLLFGRTTGAALETQDGYALTIAGILGAFDQRYAARAHLHLRKLYGRGAPLPLLSFASASGLWQACNSSYYEEQLSTVSPTTARF